MLDDANKPRLRYSTSLRMRSMSALSYMPGFSTVREKSEIRTILEHLITRTGRCGGRLGFPCRFDPPIPFGCSVPTHLVHILTGYPIG